MYKKHPMKYKELINIIAHSNGNTKIFLIIYYNNPNKFKFTFT